MKLSITQGQLILLAVFIALFVAVGVWQSKRPEGERWGSNFSLWSPVIGPGDGTEDVTGSAPAAAEPAVELPTDYGDAVNTYGMTRFQFSECNGTPGSIIVTRGSVVMLDNRNDDARTIAIGSKSYDIDAYGFVLYTADETGDLSVTCDGGGAGILHVKP